MGGASPWSPPPHSYTTVLVQMVSRRKILALCVIVAIVVKKEWEWKKKMVKKGLGEGVVEKLRANWCTPPTYEGVEPQRAIKTSVLRRPRKRSHSGTHTCKPAAYTVYYLCVPLHACISPHLLKCSVAAFLVSPLKLHPTCCVE